MNSLHTHTAHISICKICSGQLTDYKWLPGSIGTYRRDVLAKYAGAPVGVEHKLYPVFSNIAYNLQYLEYLNKCFEDLYLTSVLRAQNVKMFVLTSSQIIECFLYIKLIEMGVHKDSIWDFMNNLKTASTKNAFGLGPQFYRNELFWMKDMRNHIHIQSPADIADADYAIFESIDVLNRSKQILVYFLQRALKMSSADMKQTFYFLEPTKEFIHSREPDATL
jgi:hypothetical protein